MAIRTISATGGNWNSVTTWEEGIVPVNGDDVFGVTASGNVTLNVSTTLIKSLDLTSYTGTITGNGSNRIQPQSSGTNSSGVTWDVEPNIILGGTLNDGVFIGRDYAGAAANFGIIMGPTYVTASNGLGILSFNGSGQIKLYSDIWCQAISAGDISNNDLNVGTNSIYVSRTLTGRNRRTDAETSGYSTFKIVGDNVTGGVTYSLCQIDVNDDRGTYEFLTGTYSSGFLLQDGRYGGVYLLENVAGTQSNIIFRNGVKFIKTGSGVNDANNLMPEFALTFRNTNNYTTNILNESGQQIPKINIVDTINNNVRAISVGGSTPLDCDIVEHAFWTLDGVNINTSATQSTSTRWLGAGLSCSQYLTTPIRTLPQGVSQTFNSPNTLGTAFNNQSLFSISPSIFFTSGATHSISKLVTINGARDTSYRSSTTTTPPYPRIASDDASNVKIQLNEGGFGYNYSIDKVDFLSNRFISIGGGGVTSSTGVIQSFPTPQIKSPSNLTFLL